MNKSDEIDKLAAALCKVQKVLEGPVRDSVAGGGKSFSYRYATLEAVWRSCRKVLTDNGLSVTQGGDGEQFETVLMHVSGQWISFSQKLYLKDIDMQGLGSAITYERRYGLMAILGLSPKDDDGAAGTPRVSGQNQQSQKPLPKGNWLERKKAGEI